MMCMFLGGPLDGQQHDVPGVPVRVVASTVPDPSDPAGPHEVTAELVAYFRRDLDGSTVYTTPACLEIRPSALTWAGVWP